jgi:hypothetical protein
MAVAGGANSTDHASTFPNLVSLLRSQVRGDTLARVSETALHS